MASTSILPLDGPSSNGMANTLVDEPSRQVPIKLRTSQPTLSIPDVPYLIPTAWRRTQLSTLVNRLLQSGSGGGEDGGAEHYQTVPFDFIIDGELLRSSISHYLESKGLTEETALDIEYIRSTLPPTFTAAFEHDDWISGVDASHDGHFLTSSYDGSLRVFGMSALDQALVTFQPAPAAPLTSACWLPSAAPPSSSSRRVALTGMDGGLRICQVDPSADKAYVESLSFTNAFETPSPLSSVAVNKSGDTLATAGWDGCVAIWNASVEAQELQEGDRNVKRRKGAKGASVSDENFVGAAPSSSAAKKPLTLFWHVSPALGMDRLPNANARLSRVVWNANRSLVSAGWDGSVRVWDVANGTSASTKMSDKVILGADAMSGGQGDHVVTGHMDRSAALWDVRTSSTTNISIAFPNAHAAPVAVVRAHPTSSNLFISGAYDGTVKLWDTRSPRAALFSLVRAPGASGKKILALDWDNGGQVIVAGGEDCQLTVHRGHGIGEENLGAAMV